MTVPEGDKVMTAETLQASQLEHRGYVAAVRIITGAGGPTALLFPVAAEG